MKKLLGAGENSLSKQLASKQARWIAWALLLLAFAMRVYALGRHELAFDEVASFFIADRGPIRLLTYIRGAIREHPPLYYLFLSLWMPLAGESEFAIRFLSVIIGTVTVAATYRLMRQATHQWLALLGTLLLVVSPFHIRISRDARMYGLLALWTLVSISAFVALLKQEDDRSPSSPSRFLGRLLSGRGQSSTIQRGVAATWGLFWLATGLGVFTHYFMAFILLAEDLYLLLKWRRYRSLLLPWLAVHAVLVGLVVPWALLSPGLSETLVALWDRGIAGSIRWEALARALNGLYLGATLDPNWYHLGLCLLVTALGLLPFGRERLSVPFRPGQGSLLHILLLSMPTAAVVALPERLNGRYLTPAFPASIVAMAVGLAWLSILLRDRLLVRMRGRLRLLGASLLPLALLCGVLLVDVQAYARVYSSSEESFREKAAYLDTHARPNDGLLLHGPWQLLLLSYYDVESLDRYSVPLHGLRVNAEQVDATLKELFEIHERVWVSYDSVEPVDPNWLVSQWLHRNAHQIGTRQGLTLYYRSPALNLPTKLQTQPTESAASAVRGDHHLFMPAVLKGKNGYGHVTRADTVFGERLQLRGLALSNTALTSEEAVLVLSQWHALQHIPSGLSLRLELVGPDKRVWESNHFDTGPAHVAPPARGRGETFIERRGLLVPIGMPPGEYQLRLRVFSPEGREWLPESGDPFDVGVVRVKHHTPRDKEIRALPGHELQADFGGDISLIGYAPWGHDFTQGNPILFDIYWQALNAPDKAYELKIEVELQGGSVLTEKRVPLIAKWCPTSSWKAKDVLKGHYVVPLPADAPPGPYRTRLSLVTPDGSALMVEGTRKERVLDWWEREQTISGKDLVLFDGKIEPRSRQYAPPAMDYEMDVVLSTNEGERKARLLGYDLSSNSVEPGRALNLTLYWKTLNRMERIYAVFNHLVAPDGTMEAQQDGWPRQGTHHTSQWLPGEVVKDQYTIQVPADALAGTYTLRVGMYDAGTGDRLLTTVDGKTIPERYVELTRITITR